MITSITSSVEVILSNLTSTGISGIEVQSTQEIVGSRYPGLKT